MNVLSSFARSGKNKFKKRGSTTAILLFSLSMTPSCIEEGATLEILAIPAAQNDCSFSTTGTIFRSLGFFDFGGTSRFDTPFLVRNNLASRDENPLEGPTSEDNILPDASTVTITGFDTCFFLLSDPTIGALDFNGGDGRLVDCGKLPEAQRRFMPSSGRAEADSGLTISRLNILDTTDLKSLYGDGFDPNFIPYGTNLVDGFLAPGIELPTAAGRSTFWGAFPNDRLTDDVIIQVRARGRLPTGRSVRSNWFSYAITLCPGCVDRSCGDVAPIECPNTCTGNCILLGVTDSGCLSRDNTVCRGTCEDPAEGECAAYAYTGSLPNFTIPTCRPFFGSAAPPCAPFNGCTNNAPLGF